MMRLKSGEKIWVRLAKTHIVAQRGLKIMNHQRGKRCRE